MYEEHFGFSGRPFQLTPDPRFWCDTATHKKAMSYLGYGLSQGEGFIVITGEIGAGKTTLVGHLLGKLDPQQLHAITIGSTQIEPDDLLRTVAAGLDVAEPGAAKAELLAAIERGLHAVARSGRRTLLVIDEAQALPASALEELRMLSNIAAGGHALMQIVLLGQPEFRERLEGSDRLEQLRQRVIAFHHLGPMAADEVEAYLAHRLNVVGWSGRPRFTGAALDALHAGSGGLPRLLNQLAGRVMMHAALENLDRIDADAVAAGVADLVRDAPQRVAPAPVVAAAPAPAAAAAVVTAAAPASPVVIEALLTRLVRVEERAREGQAAADAALIARVVALEERAQDAELADRMILEGQAADTARQTALAARLDTLEERAVAPAPAPDAETLARVASLEARLEDQDATLRRILTLLVDWVETGKRPPQSAANTLSLRV